MSGRVPHRPHYRSKHQKFHPYNGSQKQFFQTHWSYRQPHPSFRKQRLGYGLSLLPRPLYPFVRIFL